jgi:hypothetical protein
VGLHALQVHMVADGQQSQQLIRELIGIKSESALTTQQLLAKQLTAGRLLCVKFSIFINAKILLFYFELGLLNWFCLHGLEGFIAHHSF